MTKSEHRVVAACADTMFPSAGPIPFSGTESGIVEYVNAYIAGLSRMRGLLVRLLFLFIQCSPLVYGPRRTLFTRLTQEERTTLFTSMSVSGTYFRRVAIFQAMRAIMTFAYMANPSVMSHIMRHRSEVPS